MSSLTKEASINNLITLCFQLAWDPVEKDNEFSR